MTGALDEACVVDLARRLKGAEAGGWSASAVRALAEEIGRGTDGAAAPRVRTVERHEEDYVHGGQECIGLHVPVALPEGGAAEKAAAFRDAAEILTKEFGPASIMGVYGDPGPFYRATALWGSPFLRWRGREDTLELYPGEGGPELLLQPTGPVENWFWRQGHGEPHAVGGFFGSRRVAANAGLGFPGRWRTDDWDVFGRALGDFLTTLPAETTALGVELDLGIHALVPGTYGPVVFHLGCGERLEIAYDPDGLDATDPVSLGWIAGTTRPAALDHWIEAPYHSGDFGIGEVDGAALSRLIVDTLRGLGVASPKGLSLSDHAQRVGDYHVEFYGLTLGENP
ncbi:hypothetical protein [Streptomyces cucumeris]|uniref:hypothetical protein n=1 Tax=Streptomyces cucumeris TaxID=2962890 RepID=UPI003D71A423